MFDVYERKRKSKSERKEGEEKEQAIIRKIKKNLRKTEAIPKEEKRAYAELQSKSQKAWQKAPRLKLNPIYSAKKRLNSFCFSISYF